MEDFRITQPNNVVQIHLPDGRTLEGPRGATAEAFLQTVGADYPAPIVGAIINGDLHELTYAITMESRIQPVTMADADGSRIYRRSLTFLLEAAFSALFPKTILLMIDHSVASGGYYCHVHGRDPLTEQELANLETEMRHMLDANLPFVRQEVTLAEAIAHFEAQGYQDKVRLFAHRQKPYVTLYQLGEHLDYHHGYMVPATGYLKWFALARSNGGFTLRFPRRQNPTAFSPLEDFPKLLAAFRQYGGWLERLGTDSVGALNDAIQAGRARELILVSEALHEQHIAALANQIAEKEDRLVLIAGPSSSGKTTFSRRLAIQLLARGLSPFALEMDNYFVDRDDSPKDENGEFDFETIEALNLDLLGKQLEALLAGQEVQIPRYNFSLGKSEPGDVVSLRPDQLIILEGIHGLNPRLIPASLAHQSFRLYASALTQLNLDRHNRVSTTDTRLIRRIVRDARERGYSAAQTIKRWESVRRGEKRHIFPYQENTDVMFNSALAYEMSVLRPLAEPLLRQVTPHTPEFIETKRLLAFLEWFLPLESDLVPDNSILREFIGGSILKGFKVWGG